MGPSWDMDVGLKRKNELPEWLPKDPVRRLQKRLVERGVSRDVLEKDEQEILEEVDEAVRFARESPYPDVSELNEHLFVKKSNAE